MRDKTLEKGCRLRIVRNRTGSIFRPNNEYCKPSRTKIIKVALPIRDGIFVCVNGRADEVSVSESREIGRVAYFGQIKDIGSGRTRKLL